MSKGCEKIVTSRLWQFCRRRRLPRAPGNLSIVGVKSRFDSLTERGYKTPIPDAQSGNREAQSLQGSRRAILGRFF
jgi:hypothetical protein